jgi:glycerophosphoryl diester phosphodiesterase
MPIPKLADPLRIIAHRGASGYAMVTLASSNHSKALVDQAHALGLEARSSGIATREQMIAAAEMGCNGMTINWPDWLMDYVRAAAENRCE